MVTYLVGLQAASTPDEQFQMCFLLPGCNLADSHLCTDLGPPESCEINKELCVGGEYQAVNQYWEYLLQLCCI